MRCYQSRQPISQTQIRSPSRWPRVFLQGVERSREVFGRFLFRVGSVNGQRGEEGWFPQKDARQTKRHARYCPGVQLVMERCFVEALKNAQQRWDGPSKKDHKRAIAFGKRTLKQNATIPKPRNDQIVLSHSPS